MDTEAEAREQGWKPEAEWKGEPPSGGFKSAEQFVKDGEQIPGILRSKLAQQDERIEALTQTNAEFLKFTNKQRDKDKAENQRLIDELETVRAQAITDGDGVAAVKAEKDIKSLEATEPPSDGREAYQKLSQKWSDDNPWYSDNKKLGRFADGIAEEIVQQGYTGKAYFKELTRQVKEMFPEDFENPARKNAAGVEKGGSRDSGSSDNQSWDNLPKADKAQAQRFIKDIPGFTKEQFLAEYDWS